MISPCRVCRFVLFMLVGAGVLVVVILNAVRYFSSRSWVETRGIVVSHVLKSESGARSSTTYDCHVRYSYTVDGKKMLSTRASISQEVGNRVLCEKQERMPKPRILPVFYNPRRPSESTSDLKLNTDILALTVSLSVIFFSVGCTGVVGGFQSKMLRSALVICAVYSICCGSLALGISVDSVIRGNKSSYVSLSVGLLFILVGLGYFLYICVLAA